MNQFINAKDSIVTEAIDGLVRASGGALARLDGYPHVKVVVRTDWDRSKVALISGGGSGHEPAHAGFVGQGMLTAAVCGEVFASPSVNAVLAAILAVTGDAGCLLIVKNYTGDRLNFGLAAERARALGRKVSMVVAGDDIALPNIPQPRGIAGTLFVHKIAGACAEQGCELNAVTAAAQRVIAGVRSIGISLDTCAMFGSQKDTRIASGCAELGLGIHGEPGARQVEFRNANAAMTMVAEQLLPYAGTGEHAVLLNNLGGTTPLEMSILAKALTESALKERIAWLIGPACYMTSLDMRGFSLSLLPLTREDAHALTAPVAPAAWLKAVPLLDNKPIPLPEGLTPITPAPSTHDARRAFVETCCSVIIAKEDTLNGLDARLGDGDTGSTLATAARALTAAMDSMPFAHMPELLSAIGMQLSNTIGGSSGVLLAIFFSAAGGADGKDIVHSLRCGLQRMMQVGGATRGDRTMIDALAPALEALPSGIGAAAKAARNGANATGAMTKAMAGRAAYVPEENLIGNNDPGAEAVALLFEGIAK